MPRAGARRRLEVAALLARLEGTVQLVVMLLYVAGMRILECLRPRVQDVDFNPVALARSKRFGAQELTRIEVTVQEHEDELMEAWRGFFSD